MKRAFELRCLALAALAFACWSVPLSAQERTVRPSQRGTVSQTVDRTIITIVYDRPVARGRELFGALVPWGRPWQPGANNATTIEFSDSVLVAGEPLAAGRYSLWTIPDSIAWTVMFSRRADAWHTQYPGEEQDALRVTLAPSTSSHMETLAYYFPVVGPDSTILNFHWGTTVVAIPIRLRVGGREIRK